MKVGKRPCPKCGTPMVYTNLTIIGGHLTAECDCPQCGYHLHVEEQDDEPS